jgi:tRNA-specific 2-thiouridylase
MQHIPPGHFLATGELRYTLIKALTPGHYARVKRTPTGATLHRARDANKDQTYYLSQVQEHQLVKVS